MLGSSRAPPFIAIVHSQHRIGGAEQHHAATAKIYVSRSTRFSLIAQCGADLLDDMRRDARFFRIDLRHTAFEIHDHFNRLPPGGTASRKLTRIVAP